MLYLWIFAFMSLCYQSLHGEQALVSKSHVKQQKHVIGVHSSGAGFFALFLGVLNHLGWCEKNRKTPVVYWGKDCLYYQSTGYNGSFNAWEYYFEPVSHLSLKKRDTIHSTYLDPANGGINFGFTSTKCLKMIQGKMWARKLIEKYVKIKPSIEAKINNFRAQYMTGKKTIGIHLRGTDKSREVPTTPLSFIIEEANKYKGYQFLVATDSQALLEQAKKLLKGPVIYYNCPRSQDERPMHFKQDKSKAQQGEDVLIEVQLLASCEKVIHTCSNVSIAVYYFNPLLEGIFFHSDKEKYRIQRTTYERY